MELRVSLIIIGGAIILAIYLLGRRGLQSDGRRFGSVNSESLTALLRKLRERVRRKAQMEEDYSVPPHAAAEPVIDTAELDNLDVMIPGHDVEISSGDEVPEDEVPEIVELGSEQIAPAGEQLFIPLTLLARHDSQFTGERIAEATDTVDMRLEDDGIYRLEVTDSQGYRQVLLGLANILEPGSFDGNTLQELRTPGLVLYLHLPAPLEAREAFDKLIKVGRALEARLDAELCDETRSVLTNQTIGHLREKIEAFRFRQKMTQVQRRRS